MQQQLSTREVGKILSLKARIVCKMCLTGELPAFKIGNSWRISEDDVNTFVTKKKNVRSGRNGKKETNER